MDPDAINPLTGRPFGVDAQLAAAMGANPLTTGRSLSAYRGSITNPDQPSSTTAAYAEPMASGVTPPGNLAFRDKLQDLQQDASDLGNKNVLISGQRDSTQQAKLYSNYLAGQKGQPLPYPELGPVKLAAPSGSSPHEFGVAGDIASSNPTELDQLARQPWRGITTGSSFGDPGHYQASQGVGGGGGVQPPAKVAGVTPVNSPSPPPPFPPPPPPPFPLYPPNPFPPPPLFPLFPPQ